MTPQFEELSHTVQIQRLAERFSRSCKALDDREYLVIIRDNSCLFCINTYVATFHLNRLDETVQMRGHIIWF